MRRFNSRATPLRITQRRWASVGLDFGADVDVDVEAAERRNDGTPSAVRGRTVALNRYHRG